MTALMSGVAIWIALHLIPVKLPSIKATLVEKIGPLTYRILSTVGILFGLALIIKGWQSVDVVPIYSPQKWGGMLTHFLMLAAFLLITARPRLSIIPRYVRHPQLTAVILWSLAHLASNGDLRSAVLFGSFLGWGLLMIGLINRRDPDWERPEAPPFFITLTSLGLGFVLYSLFVLQVHEWLIGVNPMQFT